MTTTATAAAPDTERELSLEDIMTADDRKVVLVYVPEWKGSIRLRAMSALDLIKFQNDTKSEGPGKDEAIIRALIVSAVKPDGTTPMFTVANLKDLKSKTFSAFSLLQDEILKLNGLDEQGKKRRTDNAKND